MNLVGVSVPKSDSSHCLVVVYWLKCRVSAESFRHHLRNTIRDSLPHGAPYSIRVTHIPVGEASSIILTHCALPWLCASFRIYFLDPGPSPCRGGVWPVTVISVCRPFPCFQVLVSHSAPCLHPYGLLLPRHHATSCPFFFSWQHTPPGASHGTSPAIYARLSPSRCDI